MKNRFNFSNIWKFDNIFIKVYRVMMWDLIYDAEFEL